MKKLIFIISIALSFSSFAAPNDTRIEQVNPSNSITIRVLPDPNENSFLIYNNSTNLPNYAGIGSGLNLAGGDVNVSPIVCDWNATTGACVITNKPNVADWSGITNKPLWTGHFDGSFYSLVGIPGFFDGTWASLTGKPSTFPPQFHLHSSFNISDMTIVGRDFLTAPTWAWVRSILETDEWAWIQDVEAAGGVSVVGLSNDYNDLDNLPSIPTSFFSGAYGDLTGIPSTFSPSAHNQSWSTITSTPTTRAGYGITDAEASISLGTVSQYWRGDKTWQPFPTIPTQTSQLTNNSGYATGSYVDSQVATKLTIPTGTTSQVVLGNGSLGALPVPQVIQRTRVQTDASGNYTWTYPVAYPSGVVPVISAISESSSSTIPQGVQIVGVPTNTSATFKVINLPSTSVLSIVVLGAPAGSQAYIHLTAIAP